MTKSRFKLIPAVYLFLRKDNEILLLRRANTGYQDGNYSVPAGHLEGGELASAAMAREAKEETGIIVEPKNMQFVHISNRLNGSKDQERIDLFFEAWQWQGEPKNLEPAKCDDLRWFKLSSLPDNMIPHVRLVLSEALKGQRYSEYATEP